jgi:hypothetical protein
MPKNLTLNVLLTPTAKKLTCESIKKIQNYKTQLPNCQPSEVAEFKKASKTAAQLCWTRPQMLTAILLGRLFHSILWAQTFLHISRRCFFCKKSEIFISWNFFKASVERSTTFSRPCPRLLSQSLPSAISFNVRHGKSLKKSFKKFLKVFKKS